MRLAQLSVHFADADAAAALRSDGSRRVREVSTRAATKRELLEVMASVLDFPEYFRGNWDAFEESLRDMQEGQPMLLLVRDAAPMWKRMPEELSMLVEIWMSVSAERDGELQLVFVW